MIVPTCLIQIDSTTIQEFFSKERIVELIILILAAVVATKIDWFLTLPKKLYLYFRKSEVASLWQFEVRSSRIKPGKGFNIWGFKDVFYDRDSVENAKVKFLDEKKNLILTGRSGLGKTRTAFEILSKSKENYEILVPFLTRSESFDFKSSFKKRKKVILFIDDLQKYNTDDINYYVENLFANSSEVQLLCTCRTEHEKDIFGSFQIPNLERYALKEWTESEGKSLASLLNIDFDAKAFDHTPASLIYNLEKLRERYKQLNSHQKIVLESIKLLKTISLECNSGSIKKVSEKVFDLVPEYLAHNSWRDEFKKLKTIGFYDLGKEGEVIINDIYLSELIELDFYSVFNRYFKLLKDTNNSGSLFYLGLYLEKCKDFDNAEKCFKAAIAIYPNYGSAYYKLGSLFLTKAKSESHALNLPSAKRSIEASIQYFVSAIKSKPSDYSYYITIGHVYRQASVMFDLLNNNVSKVQNLDNAINNFTKAIEINPQNAVGYRERGACNCQLKKYDDALSDYNMAKELNDKAPRLYYYLGGLYLDRNEEEKALENYRHSVELKKDYYQAYHQIAHILAKNLRKSDLSFAEKKDAAPEIIKNYLFAIWYSRGNHFVAYSNLGHFYSDLHEFYKAIKVETIVIKKSPKYSEAYAARAHALSKLHKFSEAEKDLLMAIKLKPDSEKNVTLLALCYQKIAGEMRKNGDQDSANLIFKKAIQYFDQLSASKGGGQAISAQLGKAITLEKMGEKENSLKILNELFSNNPSNTKVFSSIILHLKNTNNEDQIPDLFSVLLSYVKQKKISNISKKLMEECTFEIQRLSRIKIFSNDIEELIKLLKDAFPREYFVFKTSGILNLNKGIMQKDFNAKMNCLLEAENDFICGKNIEPDNPVFLKYIGVVNSNKCIALQERFNETQEPDYLNKYNDLVAATNKMFYESEKDFPDYIELLVEHCDFLSSNRLMSEAETVDIKARQLAGKYKTMKDDVVSKLDVFKSKRESV
jgi:tetratricopeptide (TPR) repeat protein